MVTFFQSFLLKMQSKIELDFYFGPYNDFTEQLQRNCQVSRGLDTVFFFARTTLQQDCLFWYVTIVILALSKTNVTERGVQRIIKKRAQKWVYCSYKTKSSASRNRESLVLSPTLQTNARPLPLITFDPVSKMGSGCSLWLSTSCGCPVFGSIALSLVSGSIVSP